jgi:hypothetical protein
MLKGTLDTADFTKRSMAVHASLLSGIKTRFKYLRDDALFAYATFFDPTTKSILPEEYLVDHEKNIMHQVQKQKTRAIISITNFLD